MADRNGGRSPHRAHRVWVPPRPLSQAALALWVCGVAGWLVTDLRAQQPPAPPEAPRASSAPQPSAPATVPQSTPQQAPAAPPASAPEPVQPVPAAPRGAALPVPQSMPASQPVPLPAAPRFQFTIAPNTPLKELLPPAPRSRKAAGPVLGDDLAAVREVEFQAAPAKGLAGQEAMKATAHQIAKVNFLNGKRTDGFLEALRGERPDLAGLPFAMGDACRTTGERSRQFALAVATVRRVLSPRIQTGVVTGPAPTELNIAQSGAPGSAPIPGNASVPAPAVGTGSHPEGFWDQYHDACAQEDRAVPNADRAQQEHVTVARIAALMQILAPESADLRLGLVKYLSGVSHPEATRALARLALFSAEDEVRQVAVDALQVRRERDYTAVLTQGLRYPWPAVARRAADAIVRLGRTDLVPQLVDVLDEPDPRAPVLRESDGKKDLVVRELVRVNHHRSCLLCHQPGNTGSVSPDALTAAVPVPGEPLPSPAQGYVTTSPDLLVRVDMTYLRQDFSVRQPVADANPWPEMQRFDFLVRTRVVSAEEADAYRRQLGTPQSDRPSPYQRAALAALRELTGRDTEPTAAAWRRMLDLPARKP